MQHFGLGVHAEKTRLIEFGRFAMANRERKGEGKPETFDFLGFTQICALTRNGRFTVKRRTIAKRLRRKVREVSVKLREIRHMPLPEQGNWLRQVIRGYFNYHAVPGNRRALDAFRTLLARAWFRSLRTHSQKAQHLTWDRMQVLISRWLPQAHIQHLYPNQRLCVQYPR